MLLEMNVFSILRWKVIQDIHGAANHDVLYIAFDCYLFVWFFYCAFCAMAASILVVAWTKLVNLHRYNDEVCLL